MEPPRSARTRSAACGIRRLRTQLAALALGLALLLLPRSAGASGLNVERIRLNPDQDGLHGDVQFGVDFQAGNTNRLNLRAASGLAYRRGAHVVFMIASSQYSTRTRAIDGEDLSALLQPDSRFINKASAHLRYNYEFRTWLGSEVFTQIERNEFLLLEGRVLVGLGPRFVAFNNGEFSLAIGTAYMLEYEGLDATRVVRPLPAQTIAHRWSSYLSLAYAANDRLRMSSTTYIQPRFDHFADLRLLSEALLDVMLVNPLSIRLALRLRWDSEPSIYCSDEVGIGGCPAAQEVQLREVDVAIENSISVSF